MIEWRASGVILARRHSRGVLRLAIKSRDLHYLGLRAVGQRLVPCVCRDPALAFRLTRMGRVHDLIRVSGTVEECERPNHPMLKHNLELRVREASAPRQLNRLRRLLRIKR